jgi:hypothetical protein
VEIPEQIKTALESSGRPALMLVVGVIAAIIAFKAIKFIIKVIFGLLAIGILGGAIWWLFFRTQ